jgi:cGMP-dependent protein kinase 1
MQKAEQSKKKEAMNIKFNELLFIKKLATGQFGPVYLVKAKHNGLFYALRVMSKQLIVEQNLEKHFQVKIFIIFFYIFDCLIKKKKYDKKIRLKYYKILTK